MARRLPFFAHPCLSLVGGHARFSAPRSGTTQQVRKEGRIWRLLRSSSRERIDKPCKNGLGGGYHGKGVMPPCRVQRTANQRRR